MTDARRCKDGGLPDSVLNHVLERLQARLPFSASVDIRRFKGPLAGCYELHFGDGWSLVYAETDDSVILIRLGTEDEICPKE